MTIHVAEETIFKMRNWRHHIHANPEIAYKEFETADFVAAKLAEMGLRVERGLAGTGVIGILEGNCQSDRSIGIRTELDALPIQEKTSLPYASKREGFMHACGHDGHMAMVLGAAEHLSKNRDFSGRVVFVFQPAEENEFGAVRMIKEGIFSQHPVNSIYAVHNWPGLEEGKIAVQPGPMMARFDNFDLSVRGSGGHAAMPHQLRDPLVATGQLLTAIQTIVARNIDPFDQGVISATFVNGGSVYNVVPDEVLIGGCVRSFTDEAQNIIEARLMSVAEGVGKALGVTIDLDYRRCLPATVNSPREAALAQRAAIAAVGSAMVDTDFRPSMGSEDFAEMLMVRPGAFAWIGTGPLRPDGGLHQSSYDFNDKILGVGAAYYVAIVAEELGSAAG